MTENRCWQTFSMKGQIGSILGFEGQVGFRGNSAGKQSACNAGDPGFIPGSGRSPGEGRDDLLQHSWASLLAQLVKNLPAVWETRVRSLCWEDPTEKGTATHASILAWIVHGVAKSRTGWATFTFHLISVSTTQLCRYALKAAMSDMKMNEQGSFPIKLYLGTLKFEFHLIFTCHKMFFWFFF